MALPNAIPGMTRATWTLLVLSLSAWSVAGGCKAKQRAPKAFEVCGRSKPCPGRGACILSPGVPAGACVQPCATDGDCPAGQRCTGRYQPLGSDTEPAARSSPVPGGTVADRAAPRDGAGPGAKRDAGAASTRGPEVALPRGVRTFCQVATLPLGGDCTGLREGCREGLECLRGRVCARTCRGDGDCRDDERCTEERAQRTFGTEAPLVHRTCVPASAGEGAACGPDRRPLCSRGHTCLRMRCVKTCEKDDDCGEKRMCDGQGVAPAADGDGHETFRYCRRVAAEGEACGATPERDVACRQAHRCHRGKCRRICVTDGDCSASDGRPGRCRTRRTRGSVFKVCL